MKIYRYRFKSEKEFLSEFGEDWRYEVKFSSDGSMDYLLNTVIPENLLNTVIPESKHANIISQTMFHIDKWFITSNMYKEIEYTPQFKNRVKIIKNGLLR